MVDNACAGGRFCVSTTASARNTQSNASHITVSFDKLLLPGLPIVSKQYSVELLHDASSALIPRHVLLAPESGHPLDVTIALDRPTDATVYVSASQEQPDLTVPLSSAQGALERSVSKDVAPTRTTEWRDAIRTHALTHWGGQFGAPAGLRLQSLGR